MEIKELIQHRLRDIDAVLRTNEKIKLTIFILFSTISKMIRRKVDYSIIPSSESKFREKIFSNREKTLDFLFHSRYYEPQTRKAISSTREGIFIDIGSHIGKFALLASDNYDYVYAIEANPKNYEILCKNIIKNNLSKKISASNMALSNRNGEVRIGNFLENTGVSKIVKKKGIKVMAEKLDSFIRKKTVTPQEVSCVLIDVEGHELSVLNGAKNFLKLTRANLIIECFSVKKIDSFLSKFGYKRKKV